MTTQHDKAKRWRPWRFSIRTLLLLMFGASCFFAGWTAHEWQQQRELERSMSEDPLDDLFGDAPATTPDPLFGEPMTGAPDDRTDPLDDLFGDPPSPNDYR
jgi:hypothetical protein